MKRDDRLKTNLQQRRRWKISITVKSMFDFKFSAGSQEEGLRLAKAIGNDMPPLDGYIDHEIIQDVADSGHVMVNTRWNSNEQAQAVLVKYNNDVKIKRASDLIEGGPTGFVGQVL